MSLVVGAKQLRMAVAFSAGTHGFFIRGVVLLGAIGLFCLTESSFCSAQDDSLAPGKRFEMEVQPVLKNHCVKCHGLDGTIEGEIDLLQLNAGNLDGHIELLGSIVKVLDFNEMPPEEEPAVDRSSPGGSNPGAYPAALPALRASRGSPKLITDGSMNPNHRNFIEIRLLFDTKRTHYLINWPVPCWRVFNRIFHRETAGRWFSVPRARSPGLPLATVKS